MNERIKELARQAGLIAPYGSDREGLRDFDYREFADMIVRECIAICKDIDGEDNIDARSGRQDCAVEIQEHFGVEE